MRKPSLPGGFLSLPIKGKLIVGWRLLRDPRVPLGARLLIPPIIFVYLLTPIDIVPDFIPVLGQLDDLLIVALGMGLFLRLCPPAVVKEHIRNWEIHSRK